MRDCCCSSLFRGELGGRNSEFEEAFESLSFWIHGKCYNLLPFLLVTEAITSRGLRVCEVLGFPRSHSLTSPHPFWLPICKTQNLAVLYLNWFRS